MKNPPRAIALLLMIFLPLSALAQQGHNVYFEASFDPNKAFGIIDNPRTEIDHKGLSLDLEAGVHAGRVGAFATYGRFMAADYQHLAIGADVYILTGDWYDLSAGAHTGMVFRKYKTGADYELEKWGAAIAFGLRGNFTFWAWRNVGFTVHQQIQQRPDLKHFAQYEGSLGIKVKFDIKY